MNYRYHAHKKSEQGVALLMALGILSLLLVMALAFATNAILARQSAANSRNRSQAIFLAKSAAAKIMATMKATATRTAPQIPRTDFDLLVSKTFTDANNKPNADAPKTGDATPIQDKLKGSDSILNVTLNGKNYIPKDSLDSNNLPEWELIFDKYTSDNIPGKATDAKIIGRTAFFPIPHTGQINLSYALRGETDPAFLASAPKNERNWNNRVGVDIKELDLSKISVLSETDRKNLSSNFKLEDYTGFRKLGEYGGPTVGTKKEDYSDLPNIFSSLTLDADAQQWIRKWFAASGYNEAEVYAVDPAAQHGDKELSKSVKYYHRFNLPRKSSTSNSSDWDTGLGTSANSEDAVLKLLGSDKQFQLQDNDTIKTDAIPFLRMIGENGGAYPTKEIRRKQIAANLLDYSDSDDTPTSDIANTSWWDSHPSYTGNEKTPYINEVAVQITPDINWRKTGTTEKPSITIDGNVTLDNIFVELINLYNEEMPSSIATLSGTVSVDIEINGKIQNKEIIIPKTEVTIPEMTAHSYQYGSPTSIDNSVDLTVEVIEYGKDEAPPAITITVTVKNLKINAMMLTTSANKNVDFVRNLNAPMTSTKSIQLDESNPKLEKISCAVGFAVDDPRANLYQSGNDGSINWTPNSSSFKSPTPTDPKDFDNVSINSANTVTASAAGDKEPLNNARVSTAFIANRPMTSPMELGAIHRGGKWETINLGNAKKFAAPWDYEINFDYKDGIGTTYTEGDGGILNQIKMTDKIYSPGKVNINQNDDNTTWKHDVFKALLSNVGVTGATYDCASDTSLGTAITTDALAEAVYNAGKNDPSLARAQIIEKVPGLISGTTKAERDALIGKTICLMTTRPIPQDTYQFVIVAQSIKDLGDGLELSKLGKENTPVPTHTPLTFGVFDQNSDEEVYFDEITGDIKVLVTIKYDQATQKVTLKGFEYID